MGQRNVILENLHNSLSLIYRKTKLEQEGMLNHPHSQPVAQYTQDSCINNSFGNLPPALLALNNKRQSVLCDIYLSQANSDNIT